MQIFTESKRVLGTQHKVFQHRIVEKANNL